MARRARARPVLFERAGLCPGLGFWRLGHSRRAPGLRQSRPQSPRCAGKAAVPCSPGLPCLVFCPACVFSRDVTVCSAASHKGVALLIGLWFGFGCLSVRFTLPQGELHPKAGCQSGVCVSRFFPKVSPRLFCVRGVGHVDARARMFSVQK